MPRAFYINGNFVSEDEAKVSVLDRGFLFGDGVYEVCAVLDGKLIGSSAHLSRLERSLSSIDITSPIPLSQFPEIQRALVEKNNLTEGLIYIQITRGSADRDFAFPDRAEPTIVLFTQQKNIIDNVAARNGLKVVSTPDIRWKRRDIKTIGLLAPVLAKQAAIENDADDAWLVEDGFVTEGTSNNAFIVTRGGTLVTRHLSNEILHGITRRDVLTEALRSKDNRALLNVEERPFCLEEVFEAAEAFVTSATLFVTPVVELDGKPIGNGKPGPIAAYLRQRYIEFAQRTAS